MPKFRNREEYERWKAEKLGLTEERKEPEETKEPAGEMAEGFPGDSTGRMKGGLTGLGALFSQSWKVFKKRFTTLIPLYFCSIFLFLIMAGLLFGAGFLFHQVFHANKALLILAGGVIGMVAGSIAMGWGIAAFTFAVADENLSIKEALRKGWRCLGPFMWLLSLLGFIVTGGFLLLIPGILFLVWFSFSQFVFADDDKRGMSALLKSKEYVRGHWFDVFLRFFIIWLISGVIGMVPFIGPFLSVLCVPFMMIYVYLVYRDLKAMRPNAVYSVSGVDKFKWIGLGALGYVAAPLVIVIIFGATLAVPLLVFKGMLMSQGQEMKLSPQAGMPDQGTSSPLLQEMEGVWNGFQVGGDSGWVITIDGNRITVNQPDGKLMYRGQMDIRKKKTPKQMDIKILEGPQRGHIGKTSLAIFKLEEDILTICGGEPGRSQRPTSFTPEEKSVCFELAKESQPEGQIAEGPSPEESEIKAPDVPFPRAQGAKPFQTSKAKPERIHIFIYSVNYQGLVKVNGETLQELGGKRNMQYNYNRMGENLHYGKNIFEVNYTALPEPGPLLEMTIRVSRHGSGGKKEVLGEWTIKEKAGWRSFELDIDNGS